MIAPEVTLAPLAFLRELFEAAVLAAQPEHTLAPFLPERSKGRLIVVGAGKAAASMARAVESHYGDAVEGMVITRYGYAQATRHIKVVEASHPVPDQAGLSATRKLESLVTDLQPEDTVICLISGGASALLCAPCPGISLEEKQALTVALLRSGAPITQVNCVRKALSSVKGGRLAARIAPARLITLILSDVCGDIPSAIGSGPTIADATVTDPNTILARYSIPVSDAVRLALTQNKPVPVLPPNQTFQIVGSAEQSLKRAQAHAIRLGVPAVILSDRIEGEAREAGKVLGALAQRSAAHGEPFSSPVVLISGGETTVTLRGAGRGGPNTEFLLSLALQLDGQPGVYALSCDTDGIDGSEDNAGALITPDSLERARKLQLNPVLHLEQNDAYSFFQKLGDLVLTGPTHTNVNDFRAILVLGPDGAKP